MIGRLYRVILGTTQQQSEERKRYFKKSSNVGDGKGRVSARIGGG